MGLGGAEGVRLLSLMPAAIPILIYFTFVQPLVSIGGYGPAVQRYLCLRNEREALYTAFYNAFMNFVFRSWPFYVCGLCGIFLISDQSLINQFSMISGPDGVMIPDYERVFPLLVQRYMPVGLVGLMVMGFFSAFMSSFSSNIHNSTAIFINDIYRPYVARGRDEHHYVRCSRLYMIVITALSCLIGVLSQDILKLTMFAIAISLSPGLVKLLRFIWWRVNGVTEVVTQIVSLIVALVMISPMGSAIVNGILGLNHQSGNDAFHITRQFILIGFSTLISFILILCTKPEPMTHLCAFYQRVRPFGWWGPVRKACGSDVENPDSIGIMLVISVCGIFTVFCSIFVVTGLLFALWPLCIGSGIAVLPAAWGTIWGVRRLYPSA
jgi:Na+/proline symporter